MANLDKLLQEVEKSYRNQDKIETKEIEINGNTFEFSTLTRAEKQKLFYSKKLKQNETLGDMVDWLRPSIYKCLNLAPLATKAKEAGYIKSYYDVVEMLFNATELMQVITIVLENNGISNGFDIGADVDDIKK